MDILDQTKKKMQGALDHFKTDLRALRTSRANPSMVENVAVDVYGSKMKLKEVASITVPEPRQIVITPYDHGNLHAIAKGIEIANLNLLPIVDGNLVRIRIPEMDTSVRQEIVKQAKKKCEDTKISIRNIRRDGNDLIKKGKADSTLTEDMVKKLEKNIQELTDKFCKMADESFAEKEKEILTI